MSVTSLLLMQVYIVHHLLLLQIVLQQITFSPVFLHISYGIMTNHISCPISYFERPERLFFLGLYNQADPKVLLTFPFYARRESLLCAGGLLSLLCLWNYLFFTMAL